MEHVSLGELAIKLGVNKSKLAYYYTMGLLKPIAKVGRMNIFNEEKALEIIKNIKEQKKTGKKLGEMNIK